MAHKIFGNLAYVDDGLTAVWKLTRVMKAAGWIYKSSGNGTTKDISGVAGSDLWGGAVDPMTDSAPAWLAAGSGSGAWWIGQGPSTLKIPIGTNVPSTAMIRGEKITQAVSLAEGELLGIVTDTSGGTGYLVVAPRTGTFNNSNTITGVFSAATITPSGTIVTYVREVVFWRSGTTAGAGHWFYQCVDDVGESAKRFSVRANTVSSSASYPGHYHQAGVTPSDPGNGSMACFGRLTTVTSTTNPKNWTCNTNLAALGKSHLVCANATPAAGVSADGSFFFAMGFPGNDTSSYLGFAFQRCDDNEDGDVDPYVILAPDAHTPYTGHSRVLQATPVNDSPQGLSYYCGYNLGAIVAASVPCRAFRRRGLSGEASTDFGGAGIAIMSILVPPTQNITSLSNQATGDAERVATAIVNTRVRTPIWIVSIGNAVKMRKGTLRWMYWVMGGGSSNTYDSLQWVQLGSTLVGYEACYGVVAGPWDGVTVPANA